ncbi:MAG: hypothetical protein GX312_04895, partial [Candidatus Phytoplasma sp.]|nr:hypothetical protein [Phytoplasma sp.]
PSLKWDLGDWNILDKDDFTNIGNHRYELLPTIITREVTFDSNGGTDIEPIFVDEGNVLIKPS